MNRTLAQMTAEIVENNTRLGWYENVATFPEAMAMLHSEVSEALEAWRIWGLKDATDRTGATIRSMVTPLGARVLHQQPTKPEGVGSEFADIFIRLLDDAQLFGRGYGGGCRSWPDRLQGHVPRQHEHAARPDFGRVAYITQWGFEENGAAAWRNQFGSILVFLRQLCGKYGIDLTAEYERKMAYNRTRSYRHGGKRI